MSAIDDLLPVPRTCCSDLDLDRLAVGELPDERAAALRKHLAESPSCDAHFRAMQDVPLLERPLPAPPAPRARAATRGLRLLGGGAGAAVFALAAAVVITVTQTDDDVGVRTKGDGAALEVFVQRAGGEVALADGARVAPREVLTFAVRVAAPRTVALLSRDGAGTVTIFAAPRAVPPGRTRLPDAIELDDVRGVEEVSLFICEQPVTADVLEAAVRSDEDPSGCARTTRTLDKP